MCVEQTSRCCYDDTDDRSQVTQSISFRHLPENEACFNRLNSVLLLVTVVLPSSVRVESIFDGQTILLDPSIGIFDLPRAVRYVTR
jgi:hypothetical protein